MQGKLKLVAGMAALALAGAAYAAGAAQAPAAKGYIVFEVTWTNPAVVPSYIPKAAAAVANAGGRYLVKGSNAQIKAESIDGAPLTASLAIVEFESKAAASAYLRSPEYLATAALRKQGGESRVYVVEGTPP